MIHGIVFKPELRREQAAVKRIIFRINEAFFLCHELVFDPMGHCRFGNYTETMKMETEKLFKLKMKLNFFFFFYLVVAHERLLVRAVLWRMICDLICCYVWNIHLSRVCLWWTNVTSLDSLFFNLICHLSLSSDENVRTRNKDKEYQNIHFKYIEQRNRENKRMKQQLEIKMSERLQ